MFLRIIRLEASGVWIGFLGIYVKDNETRASFVHRNGCALNHYAFSTIPDYYVGNDFALHELRKKMQFDFGARLVLVDDYAANTNKIPVQVLEK